MRSTWFGAVAVVAAIFGGGEAARAALPEGRPFVETFLPTELGVYPQNFALALDGDGVVYVGNSEGVLEFDGARWRLIELPAKRYARALASDADGRVYVGASGCFGYLARGADGRARFVDLTPRELTREQRLAMGDVWDIVPTPDAVYFRGVHDFFAWRRDGSLADTHIEKGFGVAFRDGAIVYLVRRGQGLARLDEGGFTLLPGGERMAETRTLAAIERGNGEFVIGTHEGRWYKLDASGVSDFDARATALPNPDSIFSTEALPDGRVALGLADGKLVLVSKDLTRSRELSLDATMVTELAPARDGGLWAATYRGLYHVATASPWAYLDGNDGLAGEVGDVVDWNGRAIVASTAGLYEQMPKPDALGRSFARLPYALGEVWDLEPDGRALLVAGSYKLFALREGAAPAPLTDTIYPRELARSSADPSILFVGGELGLHVLKLDGDGGAKALAHFADFGHRVHPIVEAGPRTLWLSTDVNGVFRATLSDDFTKLDKLEHFGAEHGLALGGKGGVAVSRLGDDLVFATERDLFALRGDRFVPLQRAELAGLPRRDGKLAFRTAPDGTLWAVAEKLLFHRGADGAWRTAALGGLGPLAINDVVFGRDAEAVVSVTGGLVRFSGGAEPKPPSAARVLLRGAVATRAGAEPERLALDAPAPLASGVTTLAFEYALPRFPGAAPTEYRTRLVGLDPAWSPWSIVPTASYSHLDAGDYAFEVEGRDGGGVAVPARLRFAIEPPWFRRAGALALWGAMALGVAAAAILLLVRRRTAALERRNRSLESLISERTRALELRGRELELANRQLRDLADRDGLTGVANRRRLDSVLDHACERARHDGLPLAVLMVDVDHFKAYNDQRGHLEGDRALRALADELKRFGEEHDGLVARYGGEEFALVLLGKDAAHAGTIAESLRRAAASGDLGRAGLTVSVGVATAKGEAAQPVLLLQRADAALYRAKRGGRNRVATA